MHNNSFDMGHAQGSGRITIRLSQQRPTDAILHQHGSLEFKTAPQSAKERNYRDRQSNIERTSRPYGGQADCYPTCYQGGWNNVFSRGRTCGGKTGEKQPCQSRGHVRMNVTRENTSAVQIKEGRMLTDLIVIAVQKCWVSRLCACPADGCLPLDRGDSGVHHGSMNRTRSR
ncbi:hypothetical protein Bbelb_353460 [Branchiostoma belcheri]|nr:hypothetical protein Bbelb_353460 [Branchiostoma belcheri]